MTETPDVRPDEAEKDRDLPETPDPDEGRLQIPEEFEQEPYPGPGGRQDDGEPPAPRDPAEE